MHFVPARQIVRNDAQRTMTMNHRRTPAAEIFLCAATVFAVACCGDARAQPVASCGQDLECVRNAHATHAVKSVDYWQAFRSTPVDQRVFVAPAELVDYLELDNQLNDYPNRPAAARPDEAFFGDLNAALGTIPAAVKALVDSRLMGIFLVQDLGGTGFTDYVFDRQHAPVGAFVVLDAAVLTRSANAWASWKENTPFAPDPDFTLQAVIEPADDDNRRQALQYIVLHELGHVASVGQSFHPRWDEWDCAASPPEQFPFFQLSWQLKDAQGCQVISRFDRSGFRFRSKVVYYFGAKLPAMASPEFYSQLAKTNFPSLYAATSPADDFAESFVTYVHGVLMHKPFEIRIDRLGERQTTFTGCWNTPRCAAKQQTIAALFNQ
jgi:hypothetical protein